VLTQHDYMLALFDDTFLACMSVMMTRDLVPQNFSFVFLCSTCPYNSCPSFSHNLYIYRMSWGGGGSAQSEGDNKSMCMHVCDGGLTRQR
jgi:hypothetical protein